MLERAGLCLERGQAAPGQGLSLLPVPGLQLVLIALQPESGQRHPADLRPRLHPVLHAAGGPALRRQQAVLRQAQGQPAQDQHRDR